MKPNFILKSLLVFIILFSSNLSYCQTGTTISASCGKCGKAVPSNSKAGDTCPYCGVRWGRENSTTINSSTSNSGGGINPYTQLITPSAPVVISNWERSSSRETTNNLYGLGVIFFDLCFDFYF